MFIHVKGLIMPDLKRLSIEITSNKLKKFEKALDKIGTTKRFAITKMIDDFLTNIEKVPQYFIRFEKSSKETNML